MIEANRRTTLAVGAFVIGVGALAGLILILLGARTPLLDRREKIHIRFENVAGLRKGTRVQIAGFTVGEVTGLALPPAPSPGAVATVSVKREAARRLRADATATLQTLGLLGDRAVTLDPGRAAEPLPPGRMLEQRPSTEPQAVVDRAVDAADRLGRLIDRADRVLAHVEATTLRDLAATAGSLRRVSAAAERGPGLLHALVADPTLAGDALAAVREAKRAGATVAAAGENLDQATQRLAAASSDVGEIVAHVRGGEGTLGGLVYDPAIYEGVRSIVGNVARSRALRALVRFGIERGEVERVRGTGDGK